MSKEVTRELRLYRALKTITAYASPEKLSRNSERMYGLDYHEALEMAYENVLAEAKAAIKGMREPQSASTHRPVRPPVRKGSEAPEN